ncbi:MAG TPA: hypothetical protein VG965_05680 [Patescibacteria group bacterium]|nr:hypothetical protein [Patescibacteria group bacterium]
MKNIAGFTSKIIRRFNSLAKYVAVDLKLLCESPKDYLYLYTYSNKRRVVMKPFRKDLSTTGQKIIAKIKHITPTLKVYFVGSASYKILGLNDVDLLIACPPQKFEKYTPKLSKLFGEPTKERKRFVEWKFMRNNIKVEVLLADPSLRSFSSTIKQDQLIKSNNKLLREYVEMKKKLNGSSVRQYVRQRMIFFNRISNLSASI